jgi:hypothetical protein
MIKMGLPHQGVIQKMMKDLPISNEIAEDILNKKKTDVITSESSNLESSLIKVPTLKKTTTQQEEYKDTEIDNYILSISENLEITKLINFLSKIYYNKLRVDYLLNKLKIYNEVLIPINKIDKLLLLQLKLHFEIKRERKKSIFGYRERVSELRFYSISIIIKLVFA